MLAWITFIYHTILMYFPMSVPPLPPHPILPVTIANLNMQEQAERPDKPGCLEKMRIKRGGGGRGGEI